MRPMNLHVEITHELLRAERRHHVGGDGAVLLRPEEHISRAVRDVNLAPVLERVRVIRRIEDPGGPARVRPWLLPPGDRTQGGTNDLLAVAREDLIHVRRIERAKVIVAARAAPFEINDELVGCSHVSVEAGRRAVATHRAVDGVPVHRAGGAGVTVPPMSSNGSPMGGVRSTKPGARFALPTGSTV